MPTTPPDQSRTTAEQDLAQENQRLRHLLHELSDTATHNEAVHARCHARELALLEADDLGALLNALTNDLLAAFDVQAVRLVLSDPDHSLARLLGDLGLNTRLFQGLKLCDDSEIACGRLGREMTPWLGPFQHTQHGRLFHQPGLHSIVWLPLCRGSQVKGGLALGSSDPQRFRSDQATDFLNRFTVVAALCLENGINRERLRLSGLTDALTGLYNRRYLQMRLGAEVARAIRHNQPLSCLFIDADHFKRINDEHGHAAGDQALKILAHTIRRQLRAGDLATRYGGEEVAVMLPHTNLTDAALLAERIRRQVVRAAVRLGDGINVELTVSIGVAELRASPTLNEDQLATRLLDQADQAVYQAKSSGRNRVIAYRND